MNPATDKQQMLTALSLQVKDLSGDWASYWKDAPVAVIGQRLLERAGQAWDHWQLSDFEPIEQGAVAAVFGARCQDGAVVVKLSPMLEQAPELGSEEENLQRLAASGVVALTRDSRDAGHTLLMDRLEPGHRLDQSGLSIEDQIQIIGELVVRLHQGPEAKGALLCERPWVAEWVSRAQHPLLRADLEEYLAMGPGQEIRLLHGDLHAGNVLAHGNGWRVIDPHGYVGERHADSWVMMDQGIAQLSEDDELARAQLERRFAIYAQAAGLDLARLKRAVSCRARMAAAGVTEHNQSDTGLREWAARLERMAGLVRPL